MSQLRLITMRVPESLSDENILVWMMKIFAISPILWSIIWYYYHVLLVNYFIVVKDQEHVGCRGWSYWIMDWMSEIIYFADFCLNNIYEMHEKNEMHVWCLTQEKIELCYFILSSLCLIFSITKFTC